MRNLSGKRAIVTGAASGIGCAIALELARHEVDLCLWDLDSEGLANTQNQCRLLGVECITHTCDLSKSEAITATIEQLLSEWPSVDILVNNAGVGYEGPTHEMTAQQWEAVMNINLLAPTKLIHGLLPVLLRRPEAHLVNISSMFGLCPAPRSAAYCTSKYGLVGLSESLRVEYRRTPLGVTAVCPGFVQTPLYEHGQGGDPNQPLSQPSAVLSTTPEHVARKVVRGIKRNQAKVVITPFAHLVSAINRQFPSMIELASMIGTRKKPQRAKIRTIGYDAREPSPPPLSPVTEVVREDSHFLSNGQRCSAWLYRPQTTSNSDSPIVVMAHGFAAEKSFQLPQYADRFAKQGIAVLLFDYRHFGESEGQPRQLVDHRLQHQDWLAAIAHAKTLAGIDSTRLGLWGSSFSGGHVVSVAANNPDVDVVVSQAPMLDVPRASRVKLKYIATAFWQGLRDIVQTRFGGEPNYIPVVGPPGQFAAMNQQRCETGYRALVPENQTWKNRCTARSLITSLFFRPGRKVSSLRCPTLFVLPIHDQVIRPRITRQIADRAEKAEILRCPYGHFELYQGDLFDDVCQRQADFLTHHFSRTDSLAKAA